MQGSSLLSEVAHGSIEPEAAAGLPSPTTYNNGDQYFHMRAMVLAASLPDEPKISAYGPYEDNAFSIGYTQADQDIIDRAAALCGRVGKKLGSKNSLEMPEIHRHSPNNHNSGKHPQ
jgi:hypothetical protein